MIRDDRDFSVHCDYIHYNPVRHWIVAAPKDWPYSTFHRYVEKKIYSSVWGATPAEITIDVGGE
jgi:putative transposase